MKQIKIYLILVLLTFGLAPAQIIGLSINDADGLRGSTISVPVSVDSSLTGLNVTSYQLQITCNYSYLQFIDVETGGTFTETLGSHSVNQTPDNKIIIAAAGNTPLAGTGVLIYLRFKMLISGNAYVNFDGTENNFFNEGGLDLILGNGYVHISNPPVIQVSPNDGLLTKGDQLQFYVSGGETPYTWSVTNPAAASINSSGLLTANAAGFTQVIAWDNGGIIDTCNGLIEIRAFRLSVPDTSAYQGHVLDLPVYCTSLAGLDVASGSFTLTYNMNIVEPSEIITRGTMLDGYSAPQFHASEGELNIGFAGNFPLAGEGVLLYVRFTASLVNYGAFYIDFKDILFNESITAVKDNGYCNILKLAALNVTPLTDELLAGETLQFQAGGGNTPYSWSVSDPALAEINTDGLLTALEGGTVIVTAADAVGGTGSSGNIEIYDTQVTIADTIAQINTEFDLHLNLGSIPAGMEVFSFQADITVDTAALKIPQVIISGTLSDGWSAAGKLSGKEFSIAAAGTAPITASGILVKVRFQVAPGLSDGHKSHITFNDFILNEGRPRARTQNGSVTSLITDIGSPKSDFLPGQLILEQNYPNPFNPRTTIEFSTKMNGLVTLDIYNSLGEHVDNLIERNLPAGSYDLKWNAGSLPSGIYFYRLKNNSWVQIKRMLLLK